MKLLGRTINKDDKTIIGNAVAGLFVKGGAIVVNFNRTRCVANYFIGSKLVFDVRFRHW